MTPEELDKLGALVKAATPGPWTPGALETTAICGADTDEAWSSHPFRGIGGPVVLRVDRNDMPSEQDRAAIMALHNAAPALIAAAREGERLRARVEADRSLRRIAATIADMPASDDPPPWDAICEAHIAPMRAEIERLRAFVPVWERVMGAWELRACGIRVGWVEWVGHDYIARIDVGRGGWRPAGTHPDLPTAAVAVCARLGIPSVGVGDV